MGSKNQSARRVRREFTPEFKQEAVRMLAERRAAGATLAHVARELDLGPEQLRTWTRLHAEGRNAAGTGGGETLEQENRRLRRELATLRQEQAFAKKVAVYFAKESR